MAIRATSGLGLAQNALNNDKSEGRVMVHHIPSAAFAIAAALISAGSAFPAIGGDWIVDGKPPEDPPKAAPRVYCKTASDPEACVKAGDDAAAKQATTGHDPQDLFGGWKPSPYGPPAWQSEADAAKAALAEEKRREDVQRDALIRDMEISIKKDIREADAAAARRVLEMERDEAQWQAQLQADENERLRLGQKDREQQQDLELQQAREREYLNGYIDGGDDARSAK